MLHGFISHNHHSDPTATPVLTAHHSCNGMMDAVAHAFKFDLGQNHLENFMQAQIQENCPVEFAYVSTVIFVSIFNLDDQAMQIRIPYEELIPPAPFLYVPTTRGPPAFLLS
jgi:hypothetical protein